MVFAPGFAYIDYPKGRLSLESIDLQIAAFYRSYRVWMLDIALNVAQMPDAGFAVLGLLNPYVEMYARHYHGYTVEEAKGKARQLYTEGIKLMFPSLAVNQRVYRQVGKILYESTRCAVAHLGLTGIGIHLSEVKYEYPLNVHFDDKHNVKLLGIHPKLWSKAISDHFEQYVLQLQNTQNEERRRAFSRCFLDSFNSSENDDKAKSCSHNN